MNKTAITHAIVEKLREEFDNFRTASKKTRSAGNDAESKSEGKYDTRSTEENYLADGLAKQAATIAQAAAAYEGFVAPDFAADEPIDLGAIILVKFPGETEWFFLGPAGGGTEISEDHLHLTVITPESPLGGYVMGKRSGDSIPELKARIVAIE